MDQYNSLYKKYARDLENYSDEMSVFSLQLNPENIDVQYIILGLMCIIAFIVIYIYAWRIPKDYKFEFKMGYILR